MDFFDRLIQCKSNGRFELDLDYFIHHREGVDYSFDAEGNPTVAPLFSEAMVKQFGPPRVRYGELTQRDKDLAASLQKTFEKVYLHILNHLHEQTGLTDLCLAGGVALNSVANGLIFEQTPFRRLYTQAAAGDDGTALGVASYIQHCVLGQPRRWVMTNAYTGRDHAPPSQIKVRSTRRRASSPSKSRTRNCIGAPLRRLRRARSSAGSRAAANGDRERSATAPSWRIRGCPT